MQLLLFLVSSVGVLGSRMFQGHDISKYNFQGVHEVYGAVTPPAKNAYQSHRRAIFEGIRDKLVQKQKARAASSRWFGNNEGGVAASEYEHLRTTENCVFPIDLLLLQDATGSFQVDFDVTANKTLPAIDKILPLRHPNSAISLVTFKDKPFKDLGEPDDYCLDVQTLNEPSASNLRRYYENVPVGGGYDYPENQYGALVAVLQSPNTIPWSKNPLATRLVIQVTDATPHFGGDAQQRLYPFLSKWGNTFDENDQEGFCTKRYYPTPDVVKNAIIDSRTYFASIIVRPYDPVGKPLPAWQWFNSFVGFPDNFVQASSDGLEGWFDELLDILQAIEQEECVYEATTIPPTTTPEPTTTTTLEPATTGTSSEAEQDNCVCPPSDPDCCHKAPEVLIALMKRPENLNIHLVGPEEDPNPDF